MDFIDHHRPGVEDGDYEIAVTQEIYSKDGQIPATKFEARRKFIVAGPRFQLPEADIHSVFPHGGSTGEHANVFPHVLLERSTLPWERFADKERSLPWLALLLFDASESPPATQVVSLGELGAGEAKFPSLSLEGGQDKKDRVAVIDVKRSLAERILPSALDLPLLAHVRRGKDPEDPKAVDETAVVIGNRLPRAKSTSVVHLVSLEGRYGKDGFDYQGAGAEGLVRFVSLTSWTFACKDDAQDPGDALPARLAVEAGTLNMPAKDLVKSAPFVERGFVALRHLLRDGGRTVSWYHGPLVPDRVEDSAALPVRNADQLLRYDDRLGMFDVSYASAWLIGRLLTLQSRAVSLSLHRWRRSHARHAKLQLLHRHYARPPVLARRAAAPAGLPADVTTWLGALARLEPVPFNYLVPLEKMLPAESLRFFCLDPLWVECLLHGAFSVGSTTAADHDRDAESAPLLSGMAARHATGFLLRSSLVAAWPDIVVEGRDAGGKPLGVLRQATLSENVILCLFDGELESVALHQRPETIHFGLHHLSGGGFEKKLRAGGNAGAEPTIRDLPWRDPSVAVMDFHKLSGQIRSKLGLESCGPAQFAKQMVQGVQRVVFCRPGHCGKV